MTAVDNLGTTLPQLQFLIGLKNKTEATTGHSNIVFRHELRLETRFLLAGGKLWEPPIGSSVTLSPCVNND
jgi:hypothetical protein